MNKKELRKVYPLVTVHEVVLFIVSLFLLISVSFIAYFTDSVFVAKAILLGSSLILSSISMLMSLIPFIKRYNNYKKTIGYSNNIMYINKGEFAVLEFENFHPITKLNLLSLVYRELKNYAPIHFKHPELVLCSIKRIGQVKYIQFGDKRYKKVHGVVQCGNEVQIEFFKYDIVKTFCLLMHELAHVILFYNGYKGDHHEIIRKCSFKKVALENGLGNDL
jgi:hypothetical protein